MCKHAASPTYHAQWNLHYKRCRPFTLEHSMKKLFVIVTLLFASLAQGQTLKDFTLGEQMKRAKASDLCPAGFTALKLNFMEDDSMKGYSMQACTKSDPGTIANLEAKYVHLNYMESRLESVSYVLTTRQDADRLLEALKAKYGLAIKNGYPGCDYWELSSGSRLTWCPSGSVSLASKKWHNAMANYKPTIKKQSDDL